MFRGLLQALLSFLLSYLSYEYRLLLKLMESRNQSRKVHVHQSFQNLQLN